MVAKGHYFFIVLISKLVQIEMIHFILYALLANIVHSLIVLCEIEWKNEIRIL